MKRRALVVGMAAVMGASHVAQAQQMRLHQVAVVWGTFPDRSRVLFEPLRDALLDLGHIEGRTVIFQQRWAEGKPQRIPEILESLVRLQVDVIVVPINPIIADAKRATSTIPIVMLYAIDPVGAGFVSSLGKPGGNVTGLTMGQGPETFAKNLQLLRDVSPGVSKVILLFNPDAPNFAEYLTVLEDVARPLRIVLYRQHVRAMGELERTLADLRFDNGTALLVFPDASTYAGRAQIAEWALRNRVLATSSFPDFVQSGGLMAYGANLLDLSRRGAYYIHRILKGAKPNELPVESPSRFDLVINLKTARALGLTIPPSLLLRADQVIE
jgi:putative ABC transport system substrate-binding protein